MQTKIKEAIKNHIDAASTFVLNHMGCSMSDEEVYEELIGEPHVLEAFRNCVQYLPKADFAKYVDVDYDGKTVRVGLRFNASKRYPVYFLPVYSLRVTPSSKLYHELKLGVQLATEWQTLWYVTNRILNDVDSAEIASFLLPWMRYLDLSSITAEKRGDQRFIDRELKIIKSRPMPHQFPAMTGDITDICNSGKRLFSQMRMLESGIGADAWTTMPRVPIAVGRSAEMVPDWVKQQMDSIVLDWKARLVL